MRATFILLVGAALAGPSEAEGQACGDASTTSAMRDCQDTIARGLDALLAELHADLGARYPSQADRIEASATAFASSRDAECGLVRALFEGGSVAVLQVLACRSALTAGRVRRLAVLLCDGAGMTGECGESRDYAERVERVTGGVA